jgi:uncharacterized protein YjhX (UPF0386 family)
MSRTIVRKNRKGRVTSISTITRTGNRSVRKTTFSGGKTRTTVRSTVGGTTRVQYS